MTVSLQFPLNVEDEWPPVGSESLAFEKMPDGYEAKGPPLFVRNLSVGDIIDVSKDEFGFVSKWWHLGKSSRSVVWLLRLSATEEIDRSLEKLRMVGCNTAGAEVLGCYSVDVPENVTMATVDAVLDALDASEVAVAFPSMRHSN